MADRLDSERLRGFCDRQTDRIVFASENKDTLQKCFPILSATNCMYIALWESARPKLDLPKIEARSEVSA